MTQIELGLAARDQAHAGAFQRESDRQAFPDTTARARD